MSSVIVVGGVPQWGYRFVPNSFFPHIKLNDILETQFQITNDLHLPWLHYDWMEYYELVWLHERTQKERDKEHKNEAAETQKALASGALAPRTNRGGAPNLGGLGDGWRAT